MLYIVNTYASDDDSRPDRDIYYSLSRARAYAVRDHLLDLRPGLSSSRAMYIREEDYHQLLHGSDQAHYVVRILEVELDGVFPVR